MAEIETKQCELCNSNYQQGAGIYEGHRLDLYDDMICCKSCWNGNEDGWNPSKEKLLIEHLKKKNLPIPARNVKGWLPRN